MIAARVKPKLNICIVAIISVFIIAVVFGFIGCSDPSSTGDDYSDSVVVRDVDVEYDGAWHTVSVENVSDGDEILFSTLAGGEYLSERPQYKYPGEYVIYYKVNRCGSEISGGSARVTIHKAILTGISAERVAVVFDGREHGIEISGIEVGDRIEYSTDGENFSAVAPSFSEVGEYKVFYTVERAYGEYRSSCSLLILPDLRGVYVDRRLGVVVMTDIAAEIGGNEIGMSYGIDGCGTIGDAEFSVVDGILNFNDAQYEKIGSDEKIFMLSVADEKFYLHSAQTLTAEISIDGETAVVVVGGEEIMAVDGVNYCENADTEDYAERRFEKVLSEGETALDLSKRLTRTLPRKDIFHIYDGENVDIDVEYDEVLFKTASGFVEEVPQLCEVGEYEVEAVVLSNEYLPTLWQIGIVIAPNIDGVFYNDTDAVQIDGTVVWFNGEDLTAEYDNNWTIDGQVVVLTDDGLKIGNVDFVRHTDGVVIELVLADGRHAIQTTLTSGIKIEWTSTSTVIYFDETKIIEVPLCNKTVTISTKEVTMLRDDESVGFCVIGLAELRGELIIIDIGASSEN